MSFGKALSACLVGIALSASTPLPTTASHPFYEQVNRILDGRGFDGFVEDLCRKFYHQRMGRPSLAPAAYFRLMLIGYFAGFNLSLVMRNVLGVGTARGLQGLAARVANVLLRFLQTTWRIVPHTGAEDALPTSRYSQIPAAA